MIKQNDLEFARQRLSNARWRLNNLYYITSKAGVKIPFKLNWAQELLYTNMWYCNVVLKARQLGMSTFVSLLLLDRCLFNSHQAAGIIAHTLDDAKIMFRRVKFAYDNLPDDIKSIIRADNDTTDMLTFSNGSSLRVGTSLRSSTFQYLHISEFGKICAKYPDKAEEIVTGSLNTIAPGQYIFIESTAEGRDGYFYNICKRAQNTRQDELSNIDFKFHFFPWWREPTYQTGSIVTLDQDLEEYFAHLAKLDIKLDEHQKSWYAIKYAQQQDNIKREFPSTADEAWEASNEGFYYAKKLTIARHEKRIGKIPYDDKLPVFTAWDLGYNDSTAIWFFQLYGKEIRLIDYVEGSDSFQSWLHFVKSKPYSYEKHLAPHDVDVHEYSTGITRLSYARQLGVNLIKVKKSGIIQGIDEVRNILPRCWFDENRCAQGIKALENYRKDWDDRLACWKPNPLHNWASHGADAMRTLANGLTYVGVKEPIDQTNHVKSWNNRYGNRTF